MTFRRPTLIDGGLSTALERLGADLGGPLWTARAVAEQPAILEAAHRSFVDAGAEIVITASYQCGADSVDLARTTEIARRAAGTRARVAASIGPFGASRADGSEYTGRYEVPWDVVEEYHRRKIAELVATAPDLFAVETIPLAREAALIARILTEHGSPPAWFSFGFADGGRTYGGDPVEDALAVVGDYPELVAVGVNCTHPDNVGPVVAHLHALSPRLDLVAYPNHGRRWDAVARDWVGEGSPLADAGRLAEWARLGVAFTGGCCGVGAEEIGDLARTLELLVA